MRTDSTEQPMPSFTNETTIDTYIDGIRPQPEGTIIFNLRGSTNNSKHMIFDRTKMKEGFDHSVAIAIVAATNYLKMQIALEAGTEHALRVCLFTTE